MHQLTSIGTSPNVGLPNEQIGYLASEEYTTRINTPGSHGKAHSNHSQTHVESPLRKASFPVDVEGKETFDKSNPARSQLEYALDSDTDDEVHVNPPEIRRSKYTGNGESTVDLGPHGGNTDAEGGWIEETGYGVPILASDEVAKEPGSEYLQPAVSPMQERRSSNYHSLDSEAYLSGLRNSRSGSAANSRPSSRPVSIHGTIPNLSRFTSHDEREDIHTPLEDVDEYEPLFPEEGEDRPSTAGRFKRQEMKRRFPSQDIWEDTPNSLQLQATVETPEPTEEVAPKASAVFEPPETENARKGEIGEGEKLIPKDERLAKSNFKPHVLEESQRPGLKQRFPSRDIWEDSPDSARLETTVGENEINSPDEGLKAGAVVYTSGRLESKFEQSEVVEKPSIPPRPTKSKSESASHLPSIPARPKRSNLADIPNHPESLLESKSDRKAPTLPDRPKPQVPARPARSMAHDTSEMAPLAKSTSANLVGSEGEGRIPPAPKPKPTLPSRPVNKIAALKAGFLSDLDKRLQLGPQVLKSQETAEPEIVENVPLIDARKSRARGPSRRKPATVSGPIPSSTAEGVEPKTGKQKWSIQAPWVVWETKDDSINVHTNETKSLAQTSHPEPVKSPESTAPDHLPMEPPVLADLATDQDTSKEPVSHDSSVKEFTPSSSPSPTVRNSTIDAINQTGERDISPGTEGEEKFKLLIGGNAQGDQENAVVRE